VPVARSMARPTAGGQRDQDHFGAFPAHAQDPVAVFVAEVGDARSGKSAFATMVVLIVVFRV
jgi:hypothetical protein